MSLRFNRLFVFLRTDKPSDCNFWIQIFFAPYFFIISVCSSTRNCIINVHLFILLQVTTLYIHTTVLNNTKAEDPYLEIQ